MLLHDIDIALISPFDFAIPVHSSLRSAIRVLSWSRYRFTDGSCILHIESEYSKYHCRHVGQILFAGIGRSDLYDVISQFSAEGHGEKKDGHAKVAHLDCAPTTLIRCLKEYRVTMRE